MRTRLKNYIDNVQVERPVSGSYQQAAHLDWYVLGKVLIRPKNKNGRKAMKEHS
jgi:hypothetical protein